MRRFKCKLCNQILEIEEYQDEISCPNCRSSYIRHWHVGINYENLSKKQKIMAIKKIWDLHGGEFKLTNKYAYITRNGKLAYKIDINTGIVVAGYRAPASVEDELFEALNDEEEIEEVR